MIAPSSLAAAAKSSRPSHRRNPPERERADRERQARAAVSHQEAAHDAELVRRFNAGDEAAFVEIMERYREKIFSVALAATAETCLSRPQTRAESPPR